MGSLAILCMTVFIGGWITAPLVGLVIAYLFLSRTWHRFRGNRLRVWLHGRGYTWIGLKEAAVIYAELGWRAFQLPPEDELGTVPGYEAGNVESLLSIADAGWARN